MAVKRIWHGWTVKENADIPGIVAKGIPGYQGIEVLRRELDTETEFVTIMTFDSLQNVIDFQGEDYARCYVPDAAQRVLKRWDERAEHYEAVSYTIYK